MRTARFVRKERLSESELFSERGGARKAANVEIGAESSRVIHEGDEGDVRAQEGVR